MKIAKIIVKNYRSIEEVVLEPSGFNVLVGQNNHGKTNFFEAIDWFYTGTKKDEPLNEICRERDPENNPVSVSIVFSGAKNGLEKMQNVKNQTTIAKIIGEVDNVEVIRTSDNKRRFLIDNKPIETGTGFDAALNDFLPKFEYISTKKFYQDLAKYGKTTPIGIMLSDVLESILEGDDQYIKFQEEFNNLFKDNGSKVRIELDDIGGKVKAYLVKQFPDCTDVTFEVSPPNFEDLLKNFETTVDDGVSTDASEKGDGMQRALMLSIIQAYADYRREREDIGKTFLFFIDEAEVHLHPSAQRTLKNCLLELSERGDQVFINTHSSVLVVDDHDLQNLYKVEKIDKRTLVSPVAEKIQKQEIVYQLLGGSPADLLLPSNFLIVEGLTEVSFLTIIIKNYYPEMSSIQIVPANGDSIQTARTLEGLHKVYTPLSLNPVYKGKVVVLQDSTNTDDENKLKGSFPELFPDLFYDHPESAIEKYYPNGFKKSDQEIKDLKKRKQKVNYAKEVANKISRDQFQNEMPAVYNALSMCWERAYK
ncbi:MAG TPA: AAA family ATPase [Patescibacteria group bacterium]|nr:AAA family ATPase [Patescibacteria group bacterium]